MQRLAVVVFLFTACSGSSTPANGDAAVCVEERRDIPVAISRDIDIVFVVDTSPSFDEEADTWANNIVRFANVLETYEGGLPNVHIGVVSSDVATGAGALESTPWVQGCTPPNGSFIRDVAFANGERDVNYTGPLGDTLSCIARLPATGGEIEQPLEAMKRALDGSNPANDGFLRDEAFLMVVFVGDEDDCSGGDAFELGEGEERSAWRCFAAGVECDQDVSSPGTKTECTALDDPAVLSPISEYAQFLEELKPDPSMVVVTAVMGTGDTVVALPDGDPVMEPSCTTATNDARPAHRLAAFLDEFPARNANTTVCAQDWVDIFALLAPLTTLIGPVCLDDAIDLEADEPGIQHDCAVSELRFADTDEQQEIQLPECSSSDPPDTERPCWWIEQTEDCAYPDSGPYQFDVLRGRESVPNGTTIRVRCHAGC